MIWAWTAILVAVTCDAAGPATAPSADDRIGQLIQQLGSPDPTERDEAQASLVQIGEPARAALIAAQKGDDPAIAQGAAAVVLQLPWYSQDDPPNIRQILAGYNTKSVADRCGVATALGNAGDVGPNVICRIIAIEPSDQVRWAMVGQLESEDSTARRVGVRSVPALPDSAPLLALAGWAWDKSDGQKASGYWQAALDQWKMSPHVPTLEERRLLFEPLYLKDWNAWHYDQAADVLRLQLRQDANQNDLMFQLFALHADFGPLKGYADDCALAGGQIDSPLILFCRSRIASHMMMPDEAAALQSKALEAPNGFLSTLEGTAYALGNRGWSDLAVAEYRAYLATEPVQNALGRVYAARNLYSTLVQQGEYRQGADAIQTLVDSIAAAPGQQLGIQNEAGNWVPMTTDMFMPPLHWSRLKSAQQANDAATLNTELDALARVSPDSADLTQAMAEDLVPMLTARGREGEATKFFDRFYNWQRSQVAGKPDDPWQKDDLAWYCAQCGRHLDEADDFARQAVGALPGSAACIDTLAFCEYRLGRAQEAVRLETIALSIDRNNFAYIQQLDRFRAAAAAGQAMQ